MLRWRWKRATGQEPVARLAPRRQPARRRSDRAARRLCLWRLSALRRDGGALPDHARGARPGRARHAGARHLQRLSGADRGRHAAGRAVAEPLARLHLQGRPSAGREQPDDLHLRLRGGPDDPRARRASRRRLYRRSRHARSARGARPRRVPLLRRLGAARRRRQLQRLGPRDRRRVQRDAARSWA